VFLRLLHLVVCAFLRLLPRRALPHINNRLNNRLGHFRMAVAGSENQQQRHLQMPVRMLESSSLTRRYSICHFPLAVFLSLSFPQAGIPRATLWSAPRRAKQCLPKEDATP
jgi:hypothetical protein